MRPSTVEWASIRAVKETSEDTYALTQFSSAMAEPGIKNTVPYLYLTDSLA